MSWLQWSKAGKKGNQKIHKYVDIKQHTLNQPVGQVKEESLKKLYFETNENGNTSYQNLGDAANYYSKEPIAKYLC